MYVCCSGSISLSLSLSRSLSPLPHPLSFSHTCMLPMLKKAHHVYTANGDLFNFLETIILATQRFSIS